MGILNAQVLFYCSQRLQSSDSNPAMPNPSQMWMQLIGAEQHWQGATALCFRPLCFRRFKALDYTAFFAYAWSISSTTGTVGSLLATMLLSVVGGTEQDGGSRVRSSSRKQQTSSSHVASVVLPRLRASLLTACRIKNSCWSWPTQV